MSSSLCIRLLKLSRDRAIHRKQSQTSETMPIWLALFAVLFACIAVKYYKWKRNPLTLMYNKIPGPDGYPFVGNLPMIPKIAGGIAIDLNNYKLHYAYLVSYVVLATTDDFHDFAKSSRGILDNIYLDSN